METEFHFGTPRFCEWNGIWKCSPDNEVIEEVEYESFASEFDLFCRNHFKSAPQYIEDFYLRGDYTGDKSLVVEINNPFILTAVFLQGLQDQLNTFGWQDWRVIIPTYISDEEIIIIYPTTIRISPRYEEPLENGLRSIAARMTHYRERRG